MVFLTFLLYIFLAASPIRISSPLNETHDGVVLLPNELEIISTVLFLKTPQHEKVVPKSIPITFSISLLI